MRTLLPIAVLAVIPACDTSDGSIEVRGDNPLVTGTEFTCTGQWPSSLTPCAYPWQSTANVWLSVDGTDHLRIELGRTPIPVDGGAAGVSIELVFAHGGGVVAAFAHESTTRGGDVATIESSDAVDGWISPEITSLDPTALQRGEFAIDFGWGSIAGGYVVNQPQASAP